MEQVCRLLPMRAFHFTGVVSCFLPAFYLKEFQACIEITRAMQAHLCGPCPVYFVSILPHLSHLSLYVHLVIFENHLGIANTAETT